MYGAILGDMIGCPYEFDRGNKTKDFPLFSKRSYFTDDSVMTIAVADAFLDSQPNADIEWIRNRLIRGMQRYGKLFPYAGYGGMFRRWLNSKDPLPYGSFGNGLPYLCIPLIRRLRIHSMSALGCASRKASATAMVITESSVKQERLEKSGKSFVLLPRSNS